MPTQNLEGSLAALSEASGDPLDRCEVHRIDLGGGFGCRGGTQDYVHPAVEIAKAVPDVPIKMIWSREEDQANHFLTGQSRNCPIRPRLGPSTPEAI